MQLEFTSDIIVELLAQCGDDLSICRSAWVSNLAQRKAETADFKQVKGLINSLMKQKHGSPFESGYFEFYIDAPRAVRDEHVRHRIGSYSSSSLRYNQGAARLYIPPKERPLKAVEGFKKMRPTYEPLDEDTYQEYVAELKGGYRKSYEVWERIHAITDATEATRWITHDGKMTPYIARFNPRNLMAFLSLRTHSETANHPSYPMWEIEYVAQQIEEEFKRSHPITWEAFNHLGREAP